MRLSPLALCLFALAAAGCAKDRAEREAAREEGSYAALITMASTGLLWVLQPPRACAALATTVDGSCTVDTPLMKVTIEDALGGGVFCIKDDQQPDPPWTARGWDPRLHRWRTWVGEFETTRP